MLVDTFQILYVRAAGRLWRVNLMKLCRVGGWEALPPARQQILASTGQVCEDGVDDQSYREDLDATETPETRDIYSGESGGITAEWVLRNTEAYAIIP